MFHMLPLECFFDTNYLKLFIAECRFQDNEVDECVSNRDVFDHPTKQCQSYRCEITFDREARTTNQRFRFVPRKEIVK